MMNGNHSGWVELEREPGADLEWEPEAEPRASVPETEPRAPEPGPAAPGATKMQCLEKSSQWYQNSVFHDSELQRL